MNLYQSITITLPSPKRINKFHSEMKDTPNDLQLNTINLEDFELTLFVEISLIKQTLAKTIIETIRSKKIQDSFSSDT